MITIRPAISTDIPVLFRLINEFAQYLEAPHAVAATESSLHESLFGPDAVARAILAEDAGVPVGFAVYFFNFSTWVGRPGVYLEDLYITPDARRLGVGKRMMTYLAKLATDRGAGRFEWQVYDWNAPAIKFYQSLGASPLDDLTTYRLSGDALRHLSAHDV